MVGCKNMINYNLNITTIAFLRGRPAIHTQIINLIASVEARTSNDAVEFRISGDGSYRASQRAARESARVREFPAGKLFCEQPEDWNEDAKNR